MRALLVGLVLGAAVTSCGPRDAAPHAKAEPAPSASTGSSWAVETVAVLEKRLDVTLQLPGELAPFEQVDIFSRANGFVRTVHVDRGSRVEKGDVLVRLEAPELASQRAEIEARAQGERTTLDRLQAAQRQTPGAVAEHDIELAQAAVRASASRIQSLRALEGFLVVRAPFAGVITERAIHPGALVGPPTGGRGTPMLKLESVAKLRLTVAVPEDHTSAITIGDAFTFSARAWPQRAFSGTVVRLARSVETKTRTMPVELDVDNADGALSSGMYVTVAWHARRSAPTLFVPESSVGQSTDRTFVVRIKDGRADPLAVHRGAAMAGLVEIFGDLHPGDVVARRATDELKPGTPVTVRAPAK